MQFQYDIIVLGGGIGGYSAAIRAAQLKKKVLLIETTPEMLGGECLNYGCIPTKALLTVAKLFSRLQWAQKSGLLTGDKTRLDWIAAQKFKTTIVAKLRTGVAYLCKNNGVEIAYGHGKLRTNSEIELSKGEEKRFVTARNIIIATGSIPGSLPNLKLDGKYVLSSRDVLALPAIPETICIVGGGAIGLEFGTLFAKLGTRVTIVELMSQLLPGSDEEVAQHIHRKLKREGIEIFLESTVTGYSVDASDKLEIKIRSNRDGAESIRTVDKLVVAVGRIPNTPPESNEIGIEVDRKGFIKVDSNLKTSVDGIYAIGDVTGQPMLAHKAHRQGILVAEHICLNKPVPPYVIPSVVYTEPEIASVGITESESKIRGIKVRLGKFSLGALGRSLMETGDGFVKLVADFSTDKLLGAQVMAPNASELIAELTLAVQLGLTLEDVASCIHPHPSFSEAVMEAAEVALKKSVHSLHISISEKEKNAY